MENQFRRELAKLPLLPAGEWLYITDSHDVTGLNDDGFHATFSYRYIDDDGWVLFDQKGAGCIRLIRTIGFESDLKVFIDDAPEPLIDIPFVDLHAGKHPDFPSHLVADHDKGHGSCWAIATITFQHRCKIVTPEKEVEGNLIFQKFSKNLIGPHFFNIWAHLYGLDCDDARKKAKLDGADLKEAWSGLGVDPIGINPQDMKRGQIKINPKERVNLLKHEGAGAISWIKLRLEKTNADMLKSLRLVANFDGGIFNRNPLIGGHRGPVPNVNAPVGLFFGVGYSAIQPDDREQYELISIGEKMKVSLGRERNSSIAIGELEDGTLYCYFPMPFWKDARIELENDSETTEATVAWEIGISQVAYPNAAGYFLAIHRKVDGTLSHRDYIFSDLRGTGRYIGCVARMSSRKNPISGPQRSHLEGDARFYIDDTMAPTSGSTGTEEYFNWGWYDMLPFDQLFSFPTHGYVEHVRDFQDHSTMYRLHVNDYAPYYRAFRFAIEHGPEGMSPSCYESVAFHYHRLQQSLVLTDVIDVDLNGDSEDQHKYTESGGMERYKRVLHHEGGQQVLSKRQHERLLEKWIDIAGINDHGSSFSDSCEFMVDILSFNNGVKLRRRYPGDWPSSEDSGLGKARITGPQEVIVKVDGTLAGTWYCSKHHATECWLEDEFEIPAKLVDGKSKVRLRLECTAGNSWTATKYWVFSYMTELWDDD
ncbi:MAG: DUF2961 domain-containing protein [Candidatus Hodarchaeota archaeon]